MSRCNIQLAIQLMNILSALTREQRRSREENSLKLDSRITRTAGIEDAHDSLPFQWRYPRES